MVRRWFPLVLVAATALGSWVLFADEDPGAGQPRAANAGEATAGASRAAASSPTATGDVLFRVASAAARVAGATPDSVPVTIDRQAALAAARTGSMTVALPDGTRYPVRYERSESAPDGNWTFVGRVDTPLGALASVITFGKDGVFGTLPTPDGTTMKFTTRAGQAFLQPAGFLVPPGADPSLHLDYVLPDPVVPASRRASMATSAAHPGPAVDARATVGQLADQDGGEVTITMLAAYTRNLTQLRGSRAAVETEYRNLVAVMNQAHIDSGTVARFEIAGFEEIDYPANAWNADARADIIDNTLPDGTDLHGLRNELAADLVTLIRPYTEGDLTCGISQFPGAQLQPHFLDRNTGYSVTAVESCRPLVLAHEIGHSLGLMHDRDTVAGPHGATLYYGAYPFSFGHRQLGPPGFSTVMAYDSESRPWLGYFSHPGTTLCGGAACGDAELADNVRSIDLVAETISRFREPPGVLSIGDRWVYEYSRDQDEWSVSVELSSPAPPGGVTFDIEIEPGSAEVGVDAEVVSPAALRGVSLAEGRSYFAFNVRVFADDIPESSETIGFRLSNVQGNVVVRDDHATMTIVDYDRVVRVEGNVRFPAGVDAKPEQANVHWEEFVDGIRNGYYVTARAPDYHYALDVTQGGFLRLYAYDGIELRMPDVIIENVDRPMREVDLRLRKKVSLGGRLNAEDGQRVTGVPVIIWNPNGDGSGYYANSLSGSFIPPYAVDVLPGTAMQLEVRNPPWPYVRQILEVPPLSSNASRDIRLRRVPSLTIPHVTVAEGTAADGSRTVLLTASLSVPRSETGVTFDLEVVGTAGADDFQLPKARLTIPRLRSRVEVPIVIVGDDRSEPDETVELRITNIQGAAWNPGPGSVRIATDDGHPGDGSCTGSTTDGAVRMCQ